MTVARWAIGLAVLIGSAAGTLLQQAISMLFARSHAAMSRSMLATSSVLGGLFGSFAGAVTSATTVSPEQQEALLIGLVAALGTLGAGAVAASPSVLTRDSPRFMSMAAKHIGLAILAAGLGLGLTRWMMSR